MYILIFLIFEESFSVPPSVPNNAGSGHVSNNTITATAVLIL